MSIMYSLYINARYPKSSPRQTISYHQFSCMRPDSVINSDLFEMSTQMFHSRNPVDAVYSLKQLLYQMLKGFILFHSYLLVQGIPVSKPEGRTTCAMIPGDGVGPELCQVVIEVFKAAGVPVDFEEHFLTELYPQRSAPLDMVVESITRNGICLKGILASPDYSAEGDLKTLNMKLRDSLDLYANVVHVKSLPGLNVRHKNVDMVVIREQTEGEYSALEHETIEGVIECLKIMTREKCQRIAKFAFDYATKNNRNRVTAVHKANIMKLGDGLFLKCCEE
ncbi:Isocitrate dehydrogenase [NAD] subunit beta, mitochondrial, partial [Armadillidium vulgare]